MRIKLTLMGALKGKSPPDHQLELSDGASISDVLDALGIEPQRVQIVMRNNKPAPDRGVPLEDGDELTIVPPVGGG